MKKMNLLFKPLGAIALAAALFAGSLSCPITAKADIGFLPTGDVPDAKGEILLKYIDGLSANKKVIPGKKLTFDREAFMEENDIEYTYGIFWTTYYSDGINRYYDGGYNSSAVFVLSEEYVTNGAYVSLRFETNKGTYTVNLGIEGVVTCLGDATLNLSGGSLVVSAYDLYTSPKTVFAVLTPVIKTLDGSGALKVSGLTIYADLDRDGNFDVSVEGLKKILDDFGLLYQIGLSDQKPEGYDDAEKFAPKKASSSSMIGVLKNITVTLNVLPTTNLSGSYTATLPAVYVNKCEKTYTPYTSSVTYLLPVKAVNAEAENIDASMKKPGIKKITAAKKSMTVELKALKSKQLKKVTGYEIQYSTKKDFSDAKTVTVNKAKTTKKTIKKLGKGTYFVRVRYFKKDGDTKTYSNWVKNKKSVKVK